MAAAAGDLPLERLVKLCNSLTRDIDNALASNHVPPEVSRLPSIVKLVYRHGKDTSLRSAVTLLMISIKNACRNGWFHSPDADELLQLANELLNSFNMNVCITTEGSNALNTISKIVSRFLPCMKLDRLIVSFEAKPEYEVLMADFLIQKSVTPEEAMARRFLQILGGYLGSFFCQFFTSTWVLFYALDKETKIMFSRFSFHIQNFINHALCSIRK